ncbi:hypothetical protein [Phaeobacter gallaeciensis]|uniref:hypothetical protein n=1 Tax=Phaeobacter gallaeciensis TaxID=60890 RepID=UPI00237FB6A7|nr:hypothetical protein [Phaeobacter gallaeciensis]MDE4061722.1 hypothetical protein [Phaeobacter gallaeciensis]MDE4124742.1 hypothetical protein [Phaeobacter gallaeciensis]MDE4129214.1 hypothetical protein [Phaeobacter gallaeciensis]
MTKIEFLINTDKTPLKDQWFQEFSVPEVKYSVHYFDPNLFPKDLDQEIDSLHDLVLQDAFDARNEKMPPSRKKATKITKKFKDDVYDVCALLVGNGIQAIHKGQPIAISISKHTAVGYGISKEIMRAVIEAVQKHNQFELIIGGRDKYDEDHFEAISSRLIPLKGFAELIDAQGALRIDASKQNNLALRKTVKERVYSKENAQWYTKKTKTNVKFNSEAPSLVELSNRISRINAFNSTAVIAGEGVDANGIFTTENQRKLSVNMNAYTAIHTNDFDHGGRLFAMNGIQAMPSKDRKNLTIDGAAVVELDYSSMHPTMLAALSGSSINGYFYDVECGHGEHNIEIVKLATNTCINSSSKRQATEAIRNRVMDDLNVALSADDVNAVRNAIIRTHPWVEQFFYSGFGLKLMKIERDIALHVIETMQSNNYPCFTMHDSFLAPEGAREKLKFSMKKWAASVVGAYANTHVPFEAFNVK